jgi:hypothetical protein
MEIPDKDISYSHLWACLEIFKERRGPKPATRLTRALIQEMKTHVESRAAKFVVIDGISGRRGRASLGGGKANSLGDWM